MGSFIGPNCVLALPMQEGAGDIIRDISENHNDGTRDSPTWTRLPSGLWVLSFNGDLINCGSHSSLASIFDGGGALEGWIYVASDGGLNFGRIFWKISGSAGWHLSTTGEAAGKVKLSFAIYFSTTFGTWGTTATEVTINTWTHILLNYNADNVANDPTLEVNGVSVALTESSTPVGTRVDDSAVTLYLGGQSNKTYSYDGRQALPRLYLATQSTNRHDQEKYLFEDAEYQDTVPALLGGRFARMRELAPTR